METQIDHTAEITALLEAHNAKEVLRLLGDLHAADIVRVLTSIEDDQAIELFKYLSPVPAAEVLLETDERLRAILISSISSAELIRVVEEMETDDATDIIAELPLKSAKEVLAGIKEKDSVALKKLLVYPEDTAGGKMQAELLAVHQSATVQEAIEEIRRKGRDIENLSSVFVVDSGGRLAGAVPLNKLIIAGPDVRIKDIVVPDTIKVQTDLDQEEVAKIFQKYDLLSLPVVDSAGVLVGRITVDDVVDVIEEEIFEDFYKMAGLNLEARVMDPARRSIRLRLPWLLINLATAFLAASVVHIFQGTIQKFVILAVLMPVIAGMGGNAATQTLTVVVRGLALGELSMHNARWVIFKEALVGLSNGLMVGIVATIVAYLLGANIMIGLLLFLGMTANLVIAGLAGTFIPIILKRLKIDPAISATVFVTTCTDVGGFFSFLGLATVFVRAGIL
ncbi:MAG: magnesium transporter [Deltaproteobacteria bacterium]|nr:magnesium transporter [Deltaproteobacteria bacterium]